MPGDFDKLFGDDWRPQDADAEGPAGLRGRGGMGGGSPFDSLFPFSGDERGGEDENRTPRALNEKEVKVMGVYMHQESGMPPQHFVLLRDNKARRVMIWVGQFEAWAISFALDGEAPDRPFTHDLIKQVLDRLDATVERVIVDDLWNETFYAKISVVKAGGESLDIDARPSDAIALALRVRAPIYMAENVIEAALLRTE